MKKFVIIIFACYAFQINAQEIKEMSPTLGQLLDFDTKIGDEWDKARKILEEIDYDYSKLTKENKKFFEKIGFDYNADEIDYWYSGDIGCSWYCGGGPDSISASSYLKSKNAEIDYKPSNTHDFSYKTAWVEGVKGYGIGEYLTYYFRPDAPRITDIIIANGYVKSPKIWLENSRVKKLKMYINDKPFAILNLEDSRREQSFHFEPIGRWLEYTDDYGDYEKWEEKNIWTLKFEILEVYQGDKYDDTAITELYFNGIDVHCFAKDTKILMSDNSPKNIELIKDGDFVKSYDFENKKFVNSKVTKLIEVKHDKLIKLQFADRDIVTTDDHPFFTENKDWCSVNYSKSNYYYYQEKKINELNVGDNIFLPAENKFIKLISIEKIDKAQHTYTIELANGNNFIANGLLVKTEIIK
jgi:hypothetical protein